VNTHLKISENQIESEHSQKNDDFYEQSNQQHGQHRFSSNGDAHPGHLVRARVVGSQRGEDHEESEGGRAVTATWAATILGTAEIWEYNLTLSWWFFLVLKSEKVCQN